jgi:DNA helicase-2/ATP-dependent DNA helicase PcrA
MNDYQTRLGLDFPPSKYQAGIFDHIVHGRGHGVVKAVAGSGKTTTIVAAANLISGDGLFVAFNRSIANMLGSRLEGTRMSSSTYHSHGFGAVMQACRRRPTVDNAKYRHMVYRARDAAERGSLCGRKLSGKEMDAIQEDGFPVRVATKLCDLARLSLLDMNSDSFEDDLLDLADHHNLDYTAGLESVIATTVRQCLLRGADNLDVIDCTDMIWMPVMSAKNGFDDMRPRQYGWIFVDEAQDTSACARALILMSVRPGGRTLWVGDDRQAIYGFAGADAESFQAIIDETKATVLPLSVCYRCPTAVLDVARTWCPQIEAREGAPAGVVRTVKREEYLAVAKEGDLVLCRRNAPLLELCFELIGAGVPAVVRGRDIAAGLARVVDKAAKKARSFSRFSAGLDAWEAAEVKSATKRIKDEDKRAEKVDRIGDQAKAVRVIWSRSGAISAAQLKDAIMEMFSDERGSVTLSSVHKAKGLEARRVGILDPDRLQSSRARRDWQIVQEQNIAYVAYTRAMEEIMEIPGE